MADPKHRHQQHRPHRLSVPARSNTIATSRLYSLNTSYPPSITTPTPTPSKTRLSSFPSSTSKHSKSSIPIHFLLLFSLRSLYSLLPFLRSYPSFSLFPFSFLVSLFSFVLSLCFGLFPASHSSRDPFLHQKLNQPVFSPFSISPSQRKVLVGKSLLLAVVFLLRFQALRYCGTAAMILAELCGIVTAKFFVEGEKTDLGRKYLSKVRGFVALFAGMLFLSISWDRIECFPLSTSYIEKWGYSVITRKNCVRIWPMLLPFLSGFLGCYERISMDLGIIRQLGQKRVRLISLFYTTALLFIPAVLSVQLFGGDGDGFSIWNLGWPLTNTVVFGVLLNESYSDESLVSSIDFQREFMVTFGCTVVLELFYFPELSLCGLLLCGLLIYFAIRELDPVKSKYIDLGLDSSESFTKLFMKPIRHILSERKSRKIALFLLINTGYMIVEFVAGFMSNSLGLISDACHMLFDCAALAIGLYASYISRLPANNQFNYGRGRFEVLSGYVNAVLLVLVGALIVLESLERILDPEEISTNSLLVVSIGGLLVNVVGLIFFHEEHHHAHGGSGCSHSHSHAHSHSHSHNHTQDNHHHHDHHTEQDHECDRKNQEHVLSQKLHGDSCSGHKDHHEHRHSIAKSHDCSGVAHQHVDTDDHHGNAHQHEHSDGHHHAHQHDHGDHHGHAHQHEHCHHNHDHNQHIDKACQQDHGDHHHNHHAHTNTRTSNNQFISQFGEERVPHTHDHHSDSTPQNINLSVVSEEQTKHHHHHIDHNMEGIFLHVLADTMGSVGVVISTLLIKYKGWVVADPACSIFISVLIVASVIPLLRNSAEILLQRIPRAHEQDLKEAMHDIMKIKGICGIQNLHVWSFTNTDVVGTLHLHISAETDKASTKAQVSHILQNAGIKDLTLQVECVR